MTIRIIKGSTTHGRVPYIAGTSQDVIEGIDDEDGQRLIDLGYAEKIPDPPKPLQIFAESPEKIRNKIAELEKKLSEARAEHEALLDDDLQDVAGVIRKIENASSRVSSLQLLIEKQRAKLKRAEENEQREKEKAAVKALEKATKEHKAEAEKILNGILSNIAALEENVEALYGLQKRVRDNFYASGAPFPSATCPLSNSLAFPQIWKSEIDSIKAHVDSDLSKLELMAERTPKELQDAFNAKRFKTESQLSAELKEREKKRLAEPTVTTAEAQSLDWKTFPENAKRDNYSRIGEPQTPEEYVGKIHSYA
jgi:hypothetical protein